MGLNVALVDQARVVLRDPLPVKVDGSTRSQETHGPWFRARLTLPQASVQRRYPSVITKPTLMYGVKDTNGDPVAVTSAVRVEVKSKQLGESAWLVDAEPEPIRKKRRVIGFQVNLSRAGPHEFAKPAAPVVIGE